MKPVKIHAKDADLRPIADLVPYAKNSRQHSPESVSALARGLREYGWTYPVLIDEKGGIIAGHGRVMAAQELGMTDVPVIVARGWTEDQKRAYVIWDNKSAELSTFDLDMLKSELGGLRGLGFDLSLTGFGAGELAGLFKTEGGATDPDHVPEAAVVSTSRRGDVYLLGDHRLMVGDATDQENIETLMAGLKADLVWTDPPYNVAIEGKAGSILNDDMEDSDFRSFLREVFIRCFEAMRPGAVIYVAHSDTERVSFTSAFLDAGLKLSQVLIWVKHSGTLSRQDYNWRHEPILYGWKEGGGHYYAGDFTKTTVIEDDVDVTKMTKAQLLAAVQAFIAAQAETVIRHDRPTRSNLHPTMKPVALVQDMLEASSKLWERVLDPFGGSGTTLIACERSGRRAFLMELDPRFVDVIVRRWEGFTGRAATLEATGQTFDEVASARGVPEEAV